MADSANRDFERIGISHVALVGKDMARTVDFYVNTLGMPLLKTIDLGGDMGQHFFFDCGGGDSVAFFWFPKAPPAAPGIASQPLDVTKDGFKSAHGSMNYIALDVAPEKFDMLARRLKANDVDIHEVDNKNGMSTAGGLMRSMYFHDPDGIRVEISANTRKATAADILVRPKNAKGEYVSVENRPHAADNPIVYGAAGG